MVINQFFRTFCVLLMLGQYALAQETSQVPTELFSKKQLITDEKAKKMILKNPIPESVDETIKGEEFLVKGTESDINYRQNLLTSLDVISKNIVALLKEEAGNPSDLVTLAEALSAQSSLISSAFLRDTRSIHSYTTYASPKIWKNLPKFQAKSDKFAEKVANFSTLVSESENVTLDDFSPILVSCKSCHDSYVIKHKSE